MTEFQTAAAVRLLDAIDALVDWIAKIALSDLPPELADQAKTPHQIHAALHAAVLEIETEAGRRIDPARLARAMDACLPDSWNLRPPGNAVRAKAVAREYEAAAKS